jgi:hypothetical protein
MFSNLVDAYDGMMGKDLEVEGLPEGIYRAVGFGNGKILVSQYIDGKPETVGNKWITYSVSVESIKVIKA